MILSTQPYHVSQETSLQFCPKITSTKREKRQKKGIQWVRLAFFISLFFCQRKTTHNIKMIYFVLWIRRLQWLADHKKLKIIKNKFFSNKIISLIAVLGVTLRCTEKNCWKKRKQNIFWKKAKLRRIFIFGIECFWNSYWEHEKYLNYGTFGTVHQSQVSYKLWLASGYDEWS